MKAAVATFIQEKALVGAFSVITNLRMELFEALIGTYLPTAGKLSAAAVHGPARLLYTATSGREKLLSHTGRYGPG